jgi:hypothetical protein
MTKIRFGVLPNRSPLTFVNPDLKMRCAFQFCDPGQTRLLSSRPLSIVFLAKRVRLTATLRISGRSKVSEEHRLRHPNQNGFSNNHFWDRTCRKVNIDHRPSSNRRRHRCTAPPSGNCGGSLLASYPRRAFGQALFGRKVFAGPTALAPLRTSNERLSCMGASTFFRGTTISPALQHRSLRSDLYHGSAYTL